MSIHDISLALARLAHGMESLVNCPYLYVRGDWALVVSEEDW